MQQNPHAISTQVNDPRNEAYFSAPELSAELGCSPKICGILITPSATKLHLAHYPERQQMCASSTSLMRKAPLVGTLCKPTSFTGLGETTQDQGSAKHRISASAKGSWAILNESHENKPFASAFLLVKRG